MAILIAGRCTDHCPNCVIGGDGIFEALEDENASSFSASIAIRTFVKGIATSVRAKDVKVCHWHEGAWRENKPNTSSNALILSVYVNGGSNREGMI